MSSESPLSSIVQDRPERPYRTRYAPSPTGRLHLGHARTHLVAWLCARSAGGSIVLRIDDLDTPRVLEGSESSILRDHAWLGLDWDEGPYRQSERLEAYVEALERLGEQGQLYPCTCSRKEIQQIASAPHGGEIPYPGTCRQGTSHPGRPEALRFRFEAPSPAFDDRLKGPFPQGAVEGDFVVRRADGLFAYQLAVVVDDAAQGITEVVRGDDLLDSTPRQLALYQALGLPSPSFVHVPLVLDGSGARLSKRSGSIAIEEYRQRGVSPEEMLGMLASSLGLLDAPRPIDRAELLERFALERLPRASVVFEGVFAG